MQKLYGIIPANDGTFVQISLVQEQKKWTVSQVKRWELQNTLRNILLLNKGVRLGVESKWLHKDVPDYIELQTAQAHIGDFRACTASAQFKIFSDALVNNLLGVYPDDAYLCTIPLYIAQSADTSFISISKEGDIYKVAIIIEQKLVVVFSTPVSDSRQLKGFLARVRLYWQNLNLTEQFPKVIYLLNVKDINLEDLGEIRTIAFLENDIPAIKAAGIAFCDEKAVPGFKGRTEASRLRNIRAFAYISSATIVLTAIVLFAITGILNVYYMYKIDKCKNEYNNIINQNKDIRDLLKTGSNLAEKLSRIESPGSYESNWARLLHLIGSERPQGLFVDKLGSEPMKNISEIKIAIMGWSLKEIAVTEMLKKLNGSPLITDVTLANLERDEKDKNIYKFKILCQMKSGK